MAPGDFWALVRLKLLIVFVPVLVTMWISRGLELHRSVFLSLVAMFIAAPGFGLQSLSWLVPFFVLSLDWTSLGWYMGLGGLHMMVSYWGIHFVPNLYACWPQAPWRASFSGVPCRSGATC